MNNLEELQKALDRIFFAKEHSVRKQLETWMIANGKRLYELETMLRKMEIEWQGQERNSEDFQELWIRASDVLKKVFDETFAEDKSLFEDFTKKFAVLKEFVAETLRELDEYKETCKILSDKPLMDLIRKARKYGSKSSPYKPLLVKLFSEEKVLLPVGEWLTKNAKTFPEMIEENSQCCKGFIRDCCDCKAKCGKEQWVSVDEISARLSGKVLIDRKQLSEHLKKFPFQNHECPNISKYWCERNEEGVHHTCSQKQHCEWLEQLKELLVGSGESFEFGSCVLRC